MRILNDTHKEIFLHDIREIQEVSLVPCYTNDARTVPDSLSISFDNEYVGYYKLDDTEETYTKAINNYSSILDNLLYKGYCKMSDFKNVEWY